MLLRRKQPMFLLLSLVKWVISESCGQRDAYYSHIIKGGMMARRYDWPWQVHLKVVVLTDNGSHVAADCGGSLVHPGWVVSAAHCFQANRIVEVIVTVGVLDVYGTSDGDELRQIRRLDLRDIKIHRQFDYKEANHDVALIKIRQPFTLNRSVKTVCLLKNDLNLIARPTKSWVTGWGITEEGQFSSKLRVADVFTLPLHSCGKMSHDVICAKGLAKDACKGDSGGPLVTEVNGRFHQIGIVSYGRSCLNSGDGQLIGMYARIASHCAFFDHETQSAVVCR